MNSKAFFTSFSENFYPDVELPESLINALSTAAVPHHYRKKEVVIKSGEKQTSLYFLLSGAIRCYSEKPGGHELTNNFCFTPGQPMITGAGLSPGEPAVDTMQAMEDTNLYLIPLTEIAKMKEDYPQIAEMVSEALSESFRDYMAIIRVRSLANIERCKWLNKNHPELEEHFQKQYVASYLDMDKSEYSRCQKAILESTAKPEDEGDALGNAEAKEKEES